MDSKIFDVAVIGGGINGVACASDAAMRGLSVALFEKDDLASKTSSSSTKLIHGGLRYLEQGNFAMVKKALKERQTLCSIAAHLVSPCPFVLPYEPSMRPFWLLKTGLFLYDNLSRTNRLDKSRSIKRLLQDPYFSPLKNPYNKGFLFYDCITDDARLTIANALQAQKHGAIISTHSELIEVKSKNNLWYGKIRKTNGTGTSIQSWKARTIINAAGPWVGKINQCLSIKDTYPLSLIKGSHILVPKLYEGSHAYLLQNEDKRIIFVIPYHGFSMIGTTDMPLSEPLDNLVVSPEEIDYLILLVHKYFHKLLSKKDVIASWSGMRPLLSEQGVKPQALSRDYTYHLTTDPAPAISIYSGKLTTHRQLAEEAVDSLRLIFPSLKKSQSQTTPLPGASLGEMPFQIYQMQAIKQHVWLEKKLLMRLLKNYGTHTDVLLEGCHQMKDLGKHFGLGLYQREVDYLCQNEWVVKSDDILYRRTKLGLYFSKSEIEPLDAYLSRHSAPQYFFDKT